MPPQNPELARWFAEEVQPHESMLRAWLRSRFPFTDIDDLVQESYARLIRARENGQVRNARNYLFATARNAALDLFRHESALRMEPIEENAGMAVSVVQPNSEFWLRLHLVWIFYMKTPLLIISGLCLASFTAAAVPLDPNLSHYEPHPFTVPKDASYLRPDGSIFIVGASAMSVGLANLNALFIKTHPGTKFTTLQPGSSVGPAAILFNLAAFAIIDRAVLPEESVPFEYMYNRKPLGIRVGRGSYSKRNYSPPMVICVNKANPIDKLTTEQVARIFTVGGGTGDITTWGQVGLTGPWARRSILVMGVAQRTGEGVYMRIEKFGDFPYTSHYEGMKSAEVGARLQQDVSAIAMVDMSFLPPDAKIVAIGEDKNGYYSDGSFEDVLAGRYPYTPYTYFYVNQDPDKPFDPFVKEYLRMVLSKEGQQALTNEPNGFLPLSAKDVEEQLARIK